MVFLALVEGHLFDHWRPRAPLDLQPEPIGVRARVKTSAS
mgnify:CR=1 FL=1